MTINNNQLLTWCGVPAARRAAVTAELLPNGIADLDAFSTEEILVAIKGFKDNLIEGEKFRLTALCSKKIVQLALWVKDKIRLDQDATFDNETTIAVFTKEIAASQK